MKKILILSIIFGISILNLNAEEVNQKDSLTVELAKAKIIEMLEKKIEITNVTLSCVKKSESKEGLGFCIKNTEQIITKFLENKKSL